MRLIIGLVVGLVLCAVSPAFAADEAFRVQTSGFKFRNYANNDEITNLTPEEMVRLFGPAVNARGDGSEITLTPAAEEWMDWVNEAINIGHCEGLGKPGPFAFAKVAWPKPASSANVVAHGPRRDHAPGPTPQEDFNAR